jgi:hypothetical protein
MAHIDNICDKQIRDILQSNSSIKQSTLKTVQEYLELQNRFFDEVGTIFYQLNTVKSVADIFLNDDQKELLSEFKPPEKVQLAICGYNSTGKTTFVHELLGCGNFLPTGIGAVSARIVKFSYAPASEACLFQHTSELEPDLMQEKIDLSSYFDGSTKKNNIKMFRETVKKYVGRPQIDHMSDEFAKWASHLIEIRIPSSFLQLGIDIYDTPGFLGKDPPILAKNLRKLVASLRPSLVYLYDNASVSDDSRKSFEQLKLALHHHVHDTSIFFLNTKADVLTIRKDAEDDSEDEHGDRDEDEADDFLLNREREERYKHLLKVNELSSSISDGKQLPLDQCDCFDIFTSQGSADPIESKMKKHAINSIIRFTAERDLRDTKQIINVILRTIDDFFDFVLITNRRSVEEWKKMLDHALQWIDEYFTKYKNSIDDIVNEAVKRLPIKFNQKCDEIAQRALPHYKTTWWEQVYASGVSNDSYSLPSSSAAFEYINMTVEKEVIQPILDDITSKISKNEKEKLDQTKAASQSIKNELLMAAYREVMMIGGDYGFFYSRPTRALATKIGIVVAAPFIMINAAVRYGLGKYVSFLKGSKSHVDNKIKKVEEKQLEDVLEYINDLQENIAEKSNEIKINMQKWLEKSRDQFVRKVNDYHAFVLRTLDHRQAAYDLSREFAPLFARIECCLAANLDLAKHHGLPLAIQQDTILGRGGFFTIHPATWGPEQNFVAKKLINPIADRSISCIEAHFHRTVTRLGIPNMVPLSYLYETVKDPQQFVIVLPRYPKNLHSYLMEHIQEMTIDRAAQIALDISRVIAYMHAYELVHRDVKVQNILLDENDQVFLADFGTCQHGTENSTFIGARPFVPELTTGDHQYSYQGSAFDVFCLGVLMYVLAPKDTFHQPRTLTEVEVNSLDRNQIPQSYCNLIIRCINKQPKTRPTAKEIVQELERIIDQTIIIVWQEYKVE